MKLDSKPKKKICIGSKANPQPFTLMGELKKGKTRTRARQRHNEQTKRQNKITNNIQFSLNYYFIVLFF